MHDMAAGLGMQYITAVLTEGGGLWVCGSHQVGSLGLGPPTGVETPDRPGMVLLGGVGAHVTGCEGGGPGAATHPFRNEPLVMVAAGHYHVAAVMDNGGVWVWGSDLCSELGLIPRVD